MTVYLIDGYNLMHQLVRPRGKGAAAVQARAELEAERYQIPNLEDERNRTIDLIANYMGGTEDRAIVVFDSQREALQNTESATRNVQVHFGSFDSSADDIIEREVYALHAGENVVVVTSDWELQKVVSRPDVLRLSSRQFVGDLQTYTRKIANSKNCTTMGNRVEDRIDSGVLDRLKALREKLEKEPPQ